MNDFNSVLSVIKSSKKIKVAVISQTTYSMKKFEEILPDSRRMEIHWF